MSVHITCSRQQIQHMRYIPSECLTPTPPLKKLRGTKPEAQDKWSGEKTSERFYAWAEVQEALVVKTYVASAKASEKEDAALRVKVCSATNVASIYTCLCAHEMTIDIPLHN
jgi:hypothetical protein